MADPLESFSAPVRLWFRETFGEPTPPQAQGWPPIQRGEHTLILAPTGSGKTLAAFLWAIDNLYAESREQASPPAAAPKSKRAGTKTRRGAEPEGVHLLYVSPLKALNNDIERNLRVPLDGIREVAARAGDAPPLEPLRVAVRTGDTPSHVRAAMWKKPPHILITTPESLYLMLTSPRARERLRHIRTVIVDEIHTLCGNKRGVHLALSLERLVHLAGHEVQRIGLSATIRPLEEAAQFLGGGRPVTIVNAGYTKPLDLRVIMAVEDFQSLPGDTIWPAVIPQVLQDIREHRHTLIFCNNRRLAERTADRLNAQLAAEESEEIPPGSMEALAPGGLPRDRGIFALGAAGPIRAHHGSMSKEARRKMEEDLKAGKLPALVGTSSLELGIDIGSVDLVVQLQSPKSVAQGLQRIGRSGHLVGETSIGHIYPTFKEDLLEAAALARGMLDRDVEPTVTPQNPLDVLAQQIVAMVSVENWSVSELYKVARQAYPYHDLPRSSFDAVLAMLSGHYADLTPRDLRARIVWDRVHDVLAALPGSRLLAMMNAGTITDTGAFPVYLGDGKTKIGELDEEFIFETRVGDNFLLGSHVWRVRDIEDDRIVVDDASGAVPRMPFWNGDYPWRPFTLGMRIGRFRGEVAERIKRQEGDATLQQWLERDYALDQRSARNLIDHVRRQLDAVGVISSDTTIVVESFQDAVGEGRLVVHSPFGGRINGAWALALTSALREQTGIAPEVQSNDDGILFRFPPGLRELPLDIVRSMTPEHARERILRELGDSALFGAHFRMNAARALLLPKSRGQKRTPFWLQRLKAKDLLALVRRLQDFPIVAETYRDCLRDVLDLPHLEELLSKIVRGEIRVVPIETAVPSPIASGLLFQFVSVYMYEWDAPKAERQLQNLSFRREMVEELIGARGAELRDLLRPEAVSVVAASAQHLAPGYQARTAEELAQYLLELGDLSTDEIRARCLGDAKVFIDALASQGRIVELPIRTRHGADERWVPVELAEEYHSLTASLSPGEREERVQETEESSWLSILRRWMRNSGPLTRAAILDRYAFPEHWLDDALEDLIVAREVVRGHFAPGDGARGVGQAEEYCDRRNLEQIHRRTLTLLRKEVQPVPLAALAALLTRWQHVHPDERLQPEAQGLSLVLEQLRGVALPGPVWERDVLPSRLEALDPDGLEALFSGGEWVWAGSGRDTRRGRIRFFLRGEGALFLSAPDDAGLSPIARRAYDYLTVEGASFTLDLARGLGLAPAALQEALVELVVAGLITNDSLDTLRVLLGLSPSARPAHLSSLEGELAARLPRGRPLTRGRYQDARRRVAQRLRDEPPPGLWRGRWSPLHRASILGPALSEDARADRLGRIFLARYGVVTRECLEHEEGPWDWALLYPALQLMEMRGEVRRGYFVADLAGVQFALPEAVERLRAVAATPDDALCVLNATDPANLLGAELGPLHFARVASTWCVLQNGRPILVAEDHGERITTSPDAHGELLTRAMQAFIARPNAPRHVNVSTWNGASVLGGPAEPLLHSLGFHRTPSGMEL